MAICADILGPTTIALACETLGDSCADARKTAVVAIDQRLKVQVMGKDGTRGGYLGGQDLKVSPMPAAEPVEIQLTSESMPWAPNACSLNGHFWNSGTKEIEKNFREQSCGEFHPVECRVSTLAELRVQLLTSEASAPESREKSWIDGAFLEALSCHRDRILRQIQTSGKLSLGSDSACGAAVGDYEARLAIHRAAAAKVPQDSKQLCPTGSGPKLEQAVCYARAELQALQSLFAQMAACEVFRLADESHATVLAEFRSPAAIEKQWQTISKECGESGTTCEVWNHCYRSKIQKTMQKRFRDRYPEEGECAQ
jgi:hypothetical protein